MTNLYTPESLLKTLREAVKQKPTAEEMRKQSVSFIMGSVGLESEITRADVEEALSIPDRSSKNTA